MNVFTDIKDLITAPLVGEVDAEQLWWLVGVVLVFGIVWSFIIYHVRLAAQEV